MTTLLPRGGSAPPSTPRSNNTILDTGLQYYVENLTDVPLTLPDGRTPLLRYDRIEYQCLPRQKVIVPWPVIALYFGDPRSQHGQVLEALDSRGKHCVPARGDELLRLSVFYGVYQDGVDRLINIVPNVRITTLDGIEIIPPCFDPEGDFIYGFERNMQKSSDVATLIEQLERQSNHLQSQLDDLKAAQTVREIHGDNDGEIPEDNPKIL
jgi:hypothetical protein